MNRRHGGFGALEGLLILVIVSLLGFVGWYVWHSKNSTNSAYNNAANTTATSAVTKKSDAYAGWKTFTSDIGKFSLKYPANWTYTPLDTAGSNEESAFILQSPSKDYGSFELDFGVLSKAQEGTPTDYSPLSNVQMFGNSLRAETVKLQWTSKHYNNYQPFDCARLRLLDKTANRDVVLPTSEYLTSQGGFCMNQDSYTTKSYQDQLSSQEYQNAVKVYGSIKISS